MDRRDINAVSCRRVRARAREDASSIYIALLHTTSCEVEGGECGAVRAPAERCGGVRMRAQ